MREIYLDNASTRKPYKEAIDAFVDVSLNAWGNPSNIYKISEKPKRLLQEAKQKIADTLQCSPDEIFFTSGSSEGNAWAIMQRLQTNCSAYEHANYKLNHSTQVVDENWLDTLEDGDYCDYSYAHMAVSNETGEIFNVWELFKKAHALGMLTICDITQAYCNMPINIYDFGCDIAVASGHKFGGPRGTGFVFIKKDVQDQIESLIYGSQGLRGGTQNVAGWYAMSIAAEISHKHLSDKLIHCSRLKNIIKTKLKDGNVDYRINEGENNVPSTISFSLAGIESETVQALLGDEGIYVGTGSACGNGLMEVSDTLKAMQVEEKYIHGQFRLSYGLETKEQDVEYAMDRLIKVYKELTNG